MHRICIIWNTSRITPRGLSDVLQTVFKKRAHNVTWQFLSGLKKKKIYQIRISLTCTFNYNLKALVTSESTHPHSDVSDNFFFPLPETHPINFVKNVLRKNL